MIEISIADYDDCDDLVALEESCFEYEQLSRLRFLYNIRNRNCYLVLARIDGIPAGYAMLLFHSKRSRGRINSICTAPEFRGQGVATSLIEKMEQIAARKGMGLYLEVREENAVAQKLYHSRGFIRSGKKRSHYMDGSDALIMVKDLQGDS